MLGKYVRVRVTNPIRSVNRQFGFVYQLNFGAIEGKKRYDKDDSTKAKDSKTGGASK